MAVHMVNGDLSASRTSILLCVCVCVCIKDACDSVVLDHKMPKKSELTIHSKC